MKKISMVIITLIAALLAVTTLLWQELPPFEECVTVVETCNPWAENCEDAEYEECSGMLPTNEYTVYGVLFLFWGLFYRITKWAES